MKKRWTQLLRSWLRSRKKTRLRGTTAFLGLALALMLAATSCAPSATVEPAGANPEVQSTAPFYDLARGKGKLSVRYLNLESEEKSGDAILITAPNGKHLLVDAGVPNGGPQIDAVLNKLGIEKLDAVLNTHPHIDHIGGLMTLLLTKKVGMYYHNGIPHQTETYRKVQALLQDKQVTQTVLREQDRVELDPSLVIEVLNPPIGTSSESFRQWGTEEHNNHSIVLRITHGEKRILLTGDLYKSREYELLQQYGDQLRADLMHAPHHGDMTSSSAGFVRAVKPQYVAMSANIFQSLDIRKRYEKEGANVYVTGLDGHLLFESDGKSIQAFSEKERAAPKQ